jgi:hypothetical protein
MKTEQEQGASDEARRAAGQTPADRLLERLAVLLGAKAGVEAVFGEPIMRAPDGHPGRPGPVGLRRGAGSAEGPPSGPASGSGDGNGVAADPVGYLEIGPDGAVFRPIREPYPSPLFLLASGMTAAIVLRALARVIRGCSRARRGRGALVRSARRRPKPTLSYGGQRRADSIHPRGGMRLSPCPVR